MAVIFLASDAPPKEVVKVGGFSIAAHRRGVLKYRETEVYLNSVSAVIEKSTEEREINKWVLFHAFTMNSVKTLEHYQETIAGDVVFTEEPPSRLVDYSNLIEEVYRVKFKEGGPVVSYGDLYDTFMKADNAMLDKVRNLLIQLVPSRSNYLKEVVSTAYWQLVIYFSIIEGILGMQSFCANTPRCNDCDKKLQHYPEDTKTWLYNRLLEIVGDLHVEQYFQYIWAVRQKVRHRTAHTSAHPTAEHIVLPQGETVYDLKKVIGDYDKDRTALDALLYATHDIARYLLLNQIYGYKIFPIISELHAVRIIAQPES